MRKEFPARVKAAALKRCMDSNGVPKCEGVLFAGSRHEQRCGLELRAGITHYDHDTPDGLGGEPTFENCRVLCVLCHKKKTHGEDNPRMRKADRSRKRHYGIKARRGPPMPGTRASGVKKGFDGRVVRRNGSPR